MAKEENLFEEKAKEEGGKPAANADKLKALRAAMDKIEKNYGKGSIMKLGDESIEDIEVIPTGSIALNAALGVGGYPKGRIVEIYGPESSGKTTLAIHAIAEAQKQGGIAAIIDAEHAFVYAEWRADHYIVFLRYLRMGISFKPFFEVVHIDGIPFDRRQRMALCAGHALPAPLPGHHRTDVRDHPLAAPLDPRRAHARQTQRLVSARNRHADDRHRTDQQHRELGDEQPRRRTARRKRIHRRREFPHLLRNDHHGHPDPFRRRGLRHRPEFERGAETDHLKQAI